MSTINQKEYLKKYLGIGKSPGEKKKKKKKEKAIGNRLKIIDDNIDVLISQEIEHDIAAENEDAPQIVAVIDERPLSLQIDEKTYSNLWKPVGQPSTTEADIQSVKLNTFKQIKNTDFQKSMRVTKESISYDKRNKSILTNVEQDNYSARREREKSNSPLRKNESNYNLSPAQRIINSDSPPKKKGKDYDDSKKSFRQDYSKDYNDYSPPRRKNRERSMSPKQTKYDISPLNKKRYEDDNSPPRKRNTDDSSPPRRKNRDIYSPPRRKNNGDNSPPRRNKEYDNSPPRRNKKNDSSSPKRKDKEDDRSPQRKRSKDYKNSPPRREQKSDNSPPRQRKNDYSKETRVNEEDQSPQRKRYKEDSLSPKPKNKDDRKIKREGKKSRWNVGSPEPSSSEKLRKTLDGKRAGLQSAEDLFVESKHLRQKEDEIFKKMSAEVSGRNAATVVRGKKIKDLEAEAAREKREKEMKEKYDRWGKGLKQVEDQNKRIEEQLHEMNKPLARYADDEDLEKFLKEQEREGDPMLAYIRKKKKKEKVAAGISEKPMYLGEFMPNRFGIRPGYRWDGVDRSNGYEKKWFQVQNAKKANREEAFKWSTEDM